MLTSDMPRTLTLSGDGPIPQKAEHDGSAHVQHDVLPSLSIVIPALNEEEAIQSTVESCLAARDHICRRGAVRDVEVIIVNDGSSDRTGQIADALAAREPCVSVIHFGKNRGYGAALKQGFQQARGELVAFLDADGTCDPRYFADLCAALQEFRASIAVGSRMVPGNQMPIVRRIGNVLYALLLGALSGRAVTDTASGMRVLRRDALADLYPLPDGLHFTPAMSARALLGQLRVVEVPMAYAERIGQSKLRVFRDGVRFLVAIFNALLLYRPSRIFNLLATLCVGVALTWGMYPLEFYYHHRRLEEWMIYRVLLCAFLGNCAFTFISGGVLADQILTLVYPRREQSFLEQCLACIFTTCPLLLMAALSLLVGVMLVWPGLVEYAATGHTALHWSRAIVAVYLAQAAVLALITVVLRRVIDLWRDQRLARGS